MFSPQSNLSKREGVKEEGKRGLSLSLYRKNRYQEISWSMIRVTVINYVVIVINFVWKNRIEYNSHFLV